MTDTPTSPEEELGVKQLSNKALQEMARPYAVKALKRLATLIDSNNESVAVSASKTLLAKVIPDLKSSEITGDAVQAIAIMLSGVKKSE